MSITNTPTGQFRSPQLLWQAHHSQTRSLLWIPWRKSHKNSDTTEGRAPPSLLTIAQARLETPLQPSPITSISTTKSSDVESVDDVSWAIDKYRLLSWFTAWADNTVFYPVQTVNGPSGFCFFRTLPLEIGCTFEYTFKCEGCGDRDYPVSSTSLPCMHTAFGRIHHLGWGGHC